MKRTVEENKKLCEEMPYLIIRNWKSDEIPEDYDYSHTWLDRNELPDGWQNHFEQMCYAIKKPLEDAGLLDKFFFVQVKEKYNTMRCYNNGVTKEVDDIISRYERDAQYICANCGKRATKVTLGYYLSYCDDCINPNWKSMTISEWEND